MSEDNIKDLTEAIVIGPIVHEDIDVETNEDELPLVDVEDETEIVEEDDNVVYGEVSKCEKLNVREKPEPGAKVVCKIDVGTELMIDMTNSIGKWFKIYTESGVEGYCMNDYITIK